MQIRWTVTDRSTGKDHTFYGQPKNAEERAGFKRFIKQTSALAMRGGPLQEIAV